MEQEKYIPIFHITPKPYKVSNIKVSLSEGKVVDDIDTDNEKIVIKVDYSEDKGTQDISASRKMQALS